MRKTRRRMLTVLAFALSIPVVAAQQPGEISYQDVSRLSEGAVGKRIESLIDAVNSNDPQRIRVFITKECTEQFQNIAPMDRHVEVFQGVFRTTGGLDFHRGRRSFSVGGCCRFGKTGRKASDVQSKLCFPYSSRFPEETRPKNQSVSDCLQTAPGWLLLGCGSRAAALHDCRSNLRQVTFAA